MAKHKIEVEVTKTITTTTKEVQEVSSKEYIGIKIKEFRLSKGYSQNELSEKVSFSRSNLSNLELGRFNITIPVLEEFCQVFNCKSSDILPF